MRILRHYPGRVIIYANNGARRSSALPPSIILMSAEDVRRGGGIPRLQHQDSDSKERAVVHLAHTSSRGLLRPVKHRARDFLPNSSAFRRRSLVSYGLVSARMRLH